MKEEKQNNLYSFGMGSSTPSLFYAIANNYFLALCYNIPQSKLDHLDILLNLKFFSYPDDLFKIIFRKQGVERTTAKYHRV